MDLHSNPITDVAGVVMADGNGNFLLQRRDQNPKISNPGMIGMFGGHKEAGEDALRCALREVEEETGLRLDPQQLDLIVATRVQYGNGVIRAGTFYFADRIDHSTFEVTEGELVIINYRALGDHFRQMVPTTAYVISLLSEELRKGARTLAEGGPA